MIAQPVSGLRYGITHFTLSPSVQNLGRARFLSSVSTPQINSNNVSIRPGPVSGKASHDQAPAYYLRLNGLPKTAIQNDIWRELHKARATGVKKVQLLYHQMEPNGSALLTFGSAEARAQAQKTLRSHSSSISGSPITSIFSSRETPTHRGRGAAGRAETLAGPYGGSGPDGGIVERATHVLVSGTPGKVSPGMFRGKTCDGFDLVKNTPASFNVIKMQESGALTSRFVIRTTSVAEAHRLARTLHQTYFDESRYGPKYRMRASVVY